VPVRERGLAQALRDLGESRVPPHVLRESQHRVLARPLLSPAGMTTRTHHPAKIDARSEMLTVPLLVILWTTVTVGFIMMCVVLLMR